MSRTKGNTNFDKEGDSVKKCKPRGRISTAWKSFTHLEKEKKAQCNICGTKLAFTTSTTSMNKHLAAFHNINVSTVNRVSGVGAGPSGPSGDTTKQTKIFQEKYVHSKPLPAKMQSEINNSICHVIIDIFLSFRIVDSHSFKNMCKTLNPQYIPPCRDTMLTKTLYPMYHATKDEVMKILNDADSIALTTDAWTSGAGQPYISLTVHVVDGEFTLREFLLGTVHAPESHTGLYLLDQLEGRSGLLSKWGLSNKHRTYVTDNASNIINALVTEGKQRWLGCLGHTLNLVVKAGMKVEAINKIVNNAKRTVRFIKSSGVAIEKLKKN